MEIKFTVPGVLVLVNYAPFASGSAESSYRSVTRPLPRQTLRWFASDYTKGCSHED